MSKNPIISRLVPSPEFEVSGIDKPAGRVQILGGDVYYSPNSSRDVQLPSPHIFGSNPFSPTPLPNEKRNLWRIDTSIYEQPQWWGDHYGWIAFYNKDASETSALFRIIRRSTVPYTIDDQNIGYTLPQLQMDELLRLDGQLHDACYELQNAYRFHAMPPSPTWTFGYLRPHRTHGTLSVCLEKSRKWFVVWLALLSFCIAGSEGREMEKGEHGLARQNWINTLVDKCAHVQIDHAWIDLLLDSSVPSFSSNILRTGTFVDLEPGTFPDRENSFQPNVKWFIQYRIPVWYRWDKDTASSSKSQELAPLEFQLQEADTFIRKSPSLPASTMPIDPVDSPPTPTMPVDEVAPPPPPESGKRQFSTVAMDHFFKLREERNARSKEKETPQQRALRLQREKNPPTTKTRVFEWTENSEGEFVCEELMTKALRKQTLEYYQGNQLRYDAFTNEWHACELWDDFGDDENSDIFFAYEGDDSEPQPPSPAPMQAYDDDALLDNFQTVGTGEDPPLAGQNNRRALQLQEEFLHIATVYFGYTPRIPLPNPDPLEERQQKKLCRLFGLSWKQVEPVKDAFSFPAVAAIADFSLRLAKNVDILPDEWVASSRPVFRPSALRTSYKACLSVLPFE